MCSTVLNTRLCNQIKRCKSYLHTEELENLHSVKNKYLPKRKHFSTEVHIVYMMLACLECTMHILIIDAKSKENVKVKKSVEYSKKEIMY